MGAHQAGDGLRRPVVLRWWLPLLLLLVVAAARAEAPKLAPGFEAPTRGAKLLVLPADVQLFSISGGGVNEPRADWSTDARQHLRKAMEKKLTDAGFELVVLPEAKIDEFGEQLGLQSTVSSAIQTHHLGGPDLALPTKNGQLDWSVGDAMQPLAEASGASYALFVRVRDSYASTERKAAAVGMALLGAVTGFVVVPSMGWQTAQASLIDLQTGRVLWFGAISRGSGDLREETAGLESVNALMAGFPVAR